MMELVLYKEKLENFLRDYAFHRTSGAIPVVDVLDLLEEEYKKAVNAYTDVSHEMARMQEVIEE